MPQDYISDQTIENAGYTNSRPPANEYENCSFKNCDFSNSDLSELIFTECEFINCNFSLAFLKKTALRDVVFRGCKLLGLHFEDCNSFGLAFSFEECSLNHSSFFRTNIKQTIFKNSQLIETDFTECNLTASKFEYCDLAGAVFENTILEKVDFLTALNYSIDPEVNRIKKARFSLNGLPGLLNKYDIQIDN